ncbi:hypothetical protein Vi05172_g5759 [Venturia inaequalis]|uniref:Uncharacterized protein n=1 Tax=Venturia inaequalis TaxID=5025 RepID=A0A8H3VPR8_VENIN|nr:hypothetical protein EG327_011077 [Venturia inaequalis]RDI84240.1 hypothetical protein Vi05172_g5759 [Venturia inaequalis]
MNPTAIPFTPRKTHPPHSTFSTQTTLVQTALQTVSTGKRHSRHHLPANQKVVIRISTGQTTKTITEEYPLLPLLTYSLRARRDLAHQAKATWTGATLQWIVPVRNNRDLEPGGFRLLLEFWKTLPPCGFAPDFLGRPGAGRVVMYESWIRTLGMVDMLFLHDAFLEWEPAYPLDNRRARRGIWEMLCLDGAGGILDGVVLGMLWDLFSDVDAGLVERACLKFVNGCGWGELEEETGFDCFNFTPGLRLKLARMREEKLELIALGVLPGGAVSGGSSGCSRVLGRPKRKTRRGKKKARMILGDVGDEMEVSDDGILESDALPSQSEGSYRTIPRTTSPSSPIQPGSGGEESPQFRSSPTFPDEAESNR